MEKAIANGKGKPCAGLLTAPRLKALFAACVFMPCGFSLFAAETEMVVSEPPFVAGERLTLSFLFYGMSPNAVSFEGEGGGGNAANYASHMEKAFPPSFLVESVKKSLAALPQQRALAASKGRATVIAVEAIPKEAGEFAIGPFSFIAAGERVTFPLERILVESPNASGEQQGGAIRLFWLVQERQGASFVLPSQALSLEAGKEALIILMAPASAEGSVTCPAPENALLEAAAINPLEIEELLLSRDASGYNPAAAYIWTPLFSGRQSFPKAAFSSAKGGAVSFSEDAEADVAASQAAQGAPSEQGASPDALPAAQPAPSPEKPDALYPLDTDSRFEARLAAKVSRLWDDGEYAKAAVILRSAENAFPFKKRIAEMRFSADEALMVEGRSCGVLQRCLFFAPFALLALAVILFAALVISWLASGKKGGRRGSLFDNKKLFFACAFFAALGAGATLYSHFSGGMEEAAATGGFLRRVPDSEAGAVAALKPGAPLKIESRAQSWLYVKVLSGEAGWYPSSEIIVYKTGDMHEFQ